MLFHNLCIRSEAAQSIDMSRCRKAGTWNNSQIVDKPEKEFPATNALVHFVEVSAREKKSFITLTSGCSGGGNWA
jgi:hypothetical protein